MRFAPTRFRPAFGRVLSVVMVAMALAGLTGFVVAGDLPGLLRYGWSLLLLAALAVALFWLPSLDVAEHEVTLRNVFSTIHVPWPAIERVDTKWALTLYTSEGTFTAWAGPAPGSSAVRSADATDARLASEASGASPRPGDLLSTGSGAAAYLIRRHWEQLRADGLLNAGTEPGSVRRDIHWPTIAVLAALAVATVLGVLL